MFIYWHGKKIRFKSVLLIIPPNHTFALSLSPFQFQLYGDFFYSKKPFVSGSPHLREKSAAPVVDKHLQHEALADNYQANSAELSSCCSLFVRL